MPRAGDAHIHQTALFFQALAAHLFIAALERQQAFVDAHQHHVRPFQALGGVQGAQRDHVLFVTAVGQADDHADGLRNLQDALALAFECPTVRGDLAATAARHPVHKIQHIGPARGGQFFAVTVIHQVLFVANVFQPVQQEPLGVFSAGGARGPVLQAVHGAAKFMQRVDGLALDHAGQAG